MKFSCFLVIPCIADEHESLLQATLGVRGELQKELVRQAAQLQVGSSKVETDSQGLAMGFSSEKSSKFDIDFPKCYKGFCRPEECLPVWTQNGLQVANCKERDDGSAWCSTQWDVNALSAKQLNCTLDPHPHPHAVNFGGRVRKCNSHLDCRTDSCGSLWNGTEQLVSCQGGQCMRAVGEEREVCDVKIVRDEPHSCNNGYRALPICKANFWWGWTHYSTGCTTDGSLTGTPWCSFENEYTRGSDKYASCVPCREEIKTGQNLQKWGEVVHKLREWEESAVEIGTQDGPSLQFESGGQTLDRQLRGWSVGKFIGGIAVASAVNSGLLTWESKACDFWSWWSCDEQDPRSSVTFIDALNFVSGFVPSSFRNSSNPLTQMSHNMSTESCLNDYLMDTVGMTLGESWNISSCVKQIYDNADFEDRSGDDKIVTYNSLHQTVALGMACAALNLTANEFLEQYLYQPTGMTNTYYMAGGRNIGAGIMGTASDYVKFIRHFLKGGFGDQAFMDKVNENICKEGRIPKCWGDNALGSTWAVGHAPMGNDQQIQMWIGLFQAELLADLKHKTYMVHVPAVSQTAFFNKYPLLFVTRYDSGDENTIWGDINDALGTDRSSEGRKLWFR